MRVDIVLCETVVVILLPDIRVVCNKVLLRTTNLASRADNGTIVVDDDPDAAKFILAYMHDAVQFTSETFEFILQCIEVLHAWRADAKICNAFVNHAIRIFHADTDAGRNKNLTAIENWIIKNNCIIWQFISLLETELKACREHISYPENMWDSPVFRDCVTKGALNYICYVYCNTNVRNMQYWRSQIINWILSIDDPMVLVDIGDIEVKANIMSVDYVYADMKQFARQILCSQLKIIKCADSAILDANPQHFNWIELFVRNTEKINLANNVRGDLAMPTPAAPAMPATQAASSAQAMPAPAT